MFKLKTNSFRRSNSAFTIVELLVVIVVIGILAAITIVSYTGISSRATVSSLQSDLTNASTTLKLDYVSNGTFPATLASADGGKGITQSQTLDNIIYIPDNTSNSNNFCLQYRKGNDTYAIDNNSAVTKGVCLKNLVSNGDFRDGTTGWSFGGSITDGTAAGRELTFTGKGSPLATQGYWVYQQPIFNNVSDIYYTAVRARGTTTGSLYIANSYYVHATLSMTTSNALYSAVFSPSSIYGNTPYLVFSSANGIVTTISNALVLDLTVIFGAGNEPTKAQMDTIMSVYSNSWFNIVAKANL